MSSSDLYWLPSTAMVGYGWVWLFKNGGAWKPIRGRVILGLLGLLLATASCLILLFDVVHSWTVGSFAGRTPWDGECGLLGLTAVACAGMSKGKLRMITLASAFLTFLAWFGYMWTRHVPTFSGF
jgi:hypothetical protein